MIIGYVEDNCAILSLTLRTQFGDIVEDFMIDTGFEGFLTLRPERIAALGIPFVQDSGIKLADESKNRTTVHRGAILWHNEESRVDIIALNSRPLAGAELLRGCQVCIDFEEGGLVTVGQSPLS